MTIDIKLLPKQAEALKLLTDNKTNTLLYGGSAGSGKSFLGCLWVVYMSIQYPKTRWLVGRTKLSELRQTTLKTLFEVLSILKLSKEHFTYNGMLNQFTFYNGSEIILKDLYTYTSDPDHQNLQGLEIKGAFVDEASQITEQVYNILKSRIRYKLNEYNFIPKLFLSCNPAQNWLYNTFYKPHIDNTLPQNMVFIPALPNDNHHLPESYIQSLEELLEPQKQRLLYGNWDYDDSIDIMFMIKDIISCFNNPLKEGNHYISVDIAGEGNDDSVIILWDELNIIDLQVHKNKTIPQLKEIIDRLKKEYNIPNRNIVSDNDGIGMGLGQMIVGSYKFHANGKVIGTTDINYNNLKSQCYFKLSQLVKDNLINFGSQPNHIKERIQKELSAHKIYELDKDGYNKVLPKDKVKSSLGGRSPDIADALMMRMIFEIKKSSIPKTIRFI